MARDEFTVTRGKKSRADAFVGEMLLARGPGSLPTEGPGVSHQLASGGELVQLLRDSGSAP